VAITMISIRLDRQLADEAVRVLDTKSRTEAVRVALREIVAPEALPDPHEEERGQAALRRARQVARIALG